MIDFEEQKACREAPGKGSLSAVADDGQTIAPAGTYWMELARIAFNLRYHQEQDDAE